MDNTVWDPLPTNLTFCKPLDGDARGSTAGNAKTHLEKCQFI